MSAAAAREVRIFGSVEALMRAAAELFTDCARRAIEERGRFAVALSGGSTPNALYDLLATPPRAALIDWPRVEVFWGDERCVPPDDPASNYRAARERLLDRVPVDAARVHRIEGEVDPHQAAARYERELRRALEGSRFDLVLLGLGADGHTASLFPRSAALRERERWVVAHQVKGAAGAAWRVSLTVPVLAAAAQVLFLVVGRDKSDVLRRVLEGPREPDLLPAQAIAATRGRLCWLVDAESAAELARR